MISSERWDGDGGEEDSLRREKETRVSKGRNVGWICKLWVE